MRVGMDTSALTMPVEVGVRVFEELDRHLGEPTLVAPVSVRAELETLAANSHGEEATAASVGADLLERCLELDTEAEYADDALVELGEDRRIDAAVTNDEPLRERLLEVGIPVFHARGHTTLSRTQP